MHKFFKILGIILINILLIFLGIVIHERYLPVILRLTETSIETLLFYILLFIGLLFYLIITNKTFRLFGIGIIGFLIPALLYFIFFLNRFFAFEGDYETYKLDYTNWTNNACFLNVGFNRIEVNPDKCLNIDSIQIRMDDGLFGMRTMSNHTKIIENTNCVNEVSDTSISSEKHLFIGKELAYQRCFNSAVFHFTESIKLDSTNSEAYYQRGIILMANGKYNQAILDLVNSARFRYKKLDDSTILSIDSIDFKTAINDLVYKVKNNEDYNIEEFIIKYNSRNNNSIETYQKRIEFCLQKLNEK